MGARDDLIALYWTTSGPVEVHFGREWSLYSLRERCEQARRVGFRGIGLWHADIEHLLETQTFSELRAILDEYGIDQLELSSSATGSSIPATSGASRPTGRAR